MRETVVSLICENYAAAPDNLRGGRLCLARHLLQVIQIFRRLLAQLLIVDPIYTPTTRAQYDQIVDETAKLVQSRAELYVNELK